jgi:hypothetical protein
MIKVRVQKIESIRDPDGQIGKRIELVEERITPSRLPIKPSTEEAKMVQGVVQVLQRQIPMMGMKPSFAFPKIILFLTEQEYERLGITFDVNQVYSVELSNQAIKFRKADTP